MTTTVSNLIRANVHRHNARKLEQDCHSELCLAYASGDLLDVEALRGKIAICRQVQEESEKDKTFTLDDILKSWRDEEDEE